MNRSTSPHLGLELFRPMRHEPSRLGSLLLFALIFHIGLFQVVRVSYPTSPAVWQPTVTASVTGLIDPGEGQISDAFWNSIADPTLIIQPRSWVADSSPMSWRVDPRVPDEPIVSAAQAEAENTEWLPRDLASFDERLRLALVPEVRVFDYAAARPPVVTPVTQVQWSEELRSRLMDAPSSWPSVRADLLSEAAPTVLRVSVLPSGQVAAVLVATSCGRSETDLRAVQLVRSCRFSPVSGTSALWGTITVSWAMLPTLSSTDP